MHRAPLSEPQPLTADHRNQFGATLALLAPGQGSQSPGMLSPWLDLPDAAELIERWSAVAGLDLLRLGTTATADEIKDTAVTQPLIVAFGLLVDNYLKLNEAVVIAGHSVGEITASSIAGVFDDETAVLLAARRGAEMAAACALAETGMAAVLGGDPDDVVAAIEKHGLTPANRNGAGQIVAAGSIEGLAALAAEPPAGARVRPLPVAGAFHTSYMSPAQDALRDFAETVKVSDPEHLLLSNADGTKVAHGDEALRRLVDQITRPVRWDLCQQWLREESITTVIELPPAGALAGLAKRELPGIQIIALKSPDDLEKAQAAIAEAGEAARAELASLGISGPSTRSTEV